MCQLTLVKTVNADLTKFISINAAVINPLKAKMDEKTGHVDGYGHFINRSSLWKTEFSGHEINFSSVKFTNDPAIIHVRRVSRGIISKENAHPFEFDYFVAAHNGTLSGGFLDVKETTTDSYQFFKHANDLIKENPELSVLEAFKKSYDEIDGGKFAFLVFDKRDNVYYVIRGKATLFVSYIKSKNDKTVGIIVNTERDSLLMNLYLIRAHYGYAYTEPELLSDNTIYKLNEEEIKLEKVPGIEIKQKTVTYHTVTQATTTVYDNTTTYEYKSGKLKRDALQIFFNTKVVGYQLTARDAYAAYLYAIINGYEDPIKLLPELEAKIANKTYDPIIPYALQFFMEDFEREPGYKEFIDNITIKPKGGKEK